MNSRERLLRTLNHEEPDRIPYDLASTQVTGITLGAYKKLSSFLGITDEKPEWLDVIQQVVVPAQKVFERLRVDTRGLFPLTSHNRNVQDQLEDGGKYWVYHDEWGMTHHFPKENGNWSTLTKTIIYFHSCNIQQFP